MVKAVCFNQFGGPEVLEIVDLPDPHPGPGQVRIAVRAAGINPSDRKKRQGLMGGQLPQTLGHEAAGVVDEVGESVTDVLVGDRVFGFSAEGVAQAGLTTGVPVIFGVLTCATEEQAMDRAGGKEGNKGFEAVVAAIEMVNLLKQLPAG